MKAARPFLLAALFPAVLASPAKAAECRLGLLVDLPVTMDGLRPSVPVKVNGRDTAFWLDSGAFFSVMPAAKANELDLPLSAAPFGLRLIGVGGSATVQVATIKSFGLVGQELKNVQFLVGGTDVGNGLVGRNILAIADTEFDLAHGSVKLFMPHNCKKYGMAYWAHGKPYFVAPLLTAANRRDHVFRLHVTINGARIDAAFDTGAPTSLISRKAAERAGIDLSGSGVTPVSRMGGLGRHVSKGWIAPVENVSIGDEQILKTHLAVIDGPIADTPEAPDMLLGADFMLAHHIYVARSQKRIYFTYSGGKPFLSGSSRMASAASTAAVPLPPGTQRVKAVKNPDTEPETADEFARRGNALAAQRAFPKAIADLTEAIRLEPGNAGYYSDRANAYRRSGTAARARADLDKAIELDPGNGELLRTRAFNRLRDGDKAGALADAEAAAKATHSASLDIAGLAFLFESLGQPQRAVSMLDDVIKLHRADARLGSLLNGRCWARALANTELGEALKDCNKAIKRDGAKAAYLDSRGLVHFRRGDMAKALADYDAALKLQPKLVWSLYVRGLIKIRQGDTAAGEADKAAATTLDPKIAKDANRYGIGA
ncbi:aspartyl protease family protein [Novosphingobium beihaiensis]|uniref:Aspartyl protease family protein n=1 Tax=Novosphingobium beihaiensis TaxID=2930389 RepID=A0ABT0BPE2_9SPHN|nr:aspartyl protease family protein [Novosphingobium beihaiensis]MCJ2186917.1 aspartyl protease family protein [Novosphingobium beihaiensis]